MCTLSLACCLADGDVAFACLLLPLQVAPICVYTSGKGSSAAGLTAAVVQDANSREFFLEVRSSAMAGMHSAVYTSAARLKLQHQLQA